MKKWQLALGVIVVLIGLALGTKIYLAPKGVKINPQEARAEGNPNARVKIVEFVDFQCPACAWGLEYLKIFLARHPQDLYIQVRYFPLTSLHHHALISALYSECAARQGKFWALDNLMIPQQAQWAQLINPQPVFDAMARQVGMDMNRLSACLTSNSAHKVINDEKSMGQSLGITSTPTYFINNKMVVGTKSLQEELKKYFPGG
ncbi:MAG: thioredoxin domain-containing protein [Candidatus Omnitrophica bacterium]|nr:thioredoxin domain-containing protein [Candidatus Omnitrophota bacterium]MDE2214062.1 thioredoxin domain-containing protein [Candidatus Omnitrophota bacterium]MDE2230960.1 thioredoxin domain-containing protein [Candidatus Omnitrophota bacterium]